jgi:hypothetical protein
LININILKNNCAPRWFYLQDYKTHFSLCGTKFVVRTQTECFLGILVTTGQITFHNISKKLKSIISYQIHPLSLSRCNMKKDRFLSFIWRRSQRLILYCVEWWCGQYWIDQWGVHKSCCYWTLLGRSIEKDGMVGACGKNDRRLQIFL